MGCNSICMNLHKTCFTSSLKFWIICITTVLSIQMLVQHFSGGYGFFTCWSVWDVMQHLWNMNPLITGVQPGAKPGMSEQLHSCRKGGWMQAFWSRLSVTGSSLLISPAPESHSNFVCQKPFSRLAYREQGLWFLFELDFSDIAHLCSSFQIACSFLNYAMLW